MTRTRDIGPKVRVPQMGGQYFRQALLEGLGPYPGTDQPTTQA